MGSNPTPSAIHPGPFKDGRDGRRGRRAPWIYSLTAVMVAVPELPAVSV